MFFKYAIFFCVFLLIVYTQATENTETTSAQPSLNIVSLKKNMDEFKKCIDQSLASVVGGVNEDHLQPLFNVIGDHLNRFSRAFDEITASKPATPDIN